MHRIHLHEGLRLFLKHAGTSAYRTPPERGRGRRPTNNAQKDGHRRGKRKTGCAHLLAIISTTRSCLSRHGNTMNIPQLMSFSCWSPVQVNRGKPLCPKGKISQSSQNSTKWGTTSGPPSTTRVVRGFTCARCVGRSWLRELGGLCSPQTPTIADPTDRGVSGSDTARGTANQRTNEPTNGRVM